MTRAEFLKVFPHATESAIRCNCSDAVARLEPAPRQAQRAAQPQKKGVQRARRVPTPRNAGTWSEARYWQAVRSGLRRAFRFWRPATDALHAARTAMRGAHGAKWAYQCAKCRKFFRRRGVQVDHVQPCGKLTSPDHLAEFLARLTAEGPAAYQVLCLTCHPKKTGAERANVPRGTMAGRPPP